MSLAHHDFQRWVDEHGPALFRMAFRMVGDRHEAEDLVQDTFRSAWKSRHLFDVTRGERAWLAAILRRRAVDFWRRGDSKSVTAGEATLELSVEGDDPLAGEYSDEIQGALNKLPGELRETLLLVVVAELTHQEAADLLGVPLGTVLSRVSRARGRLREFLLAAAESAR